MIEFQRNHFSVNLSTRRVKNSLVLFFLDTAFSQPIYNLTSEVFFVISAVECMWKSIEISTAVIVE